MAPECLQARGERETRERRCVGLSACSVPQLACSLCVTCVREHEVWNWWSALWVSTVCRCVACRFPPLLQGRKVICLCVSEPYAGSDVAVRTRPPTHHRRLSHVLNPQTPTE